MIGAFEAFGLELEYMIVRGDTLDVLPVAERALEARPAEWWSNELVAHVVELKNPRPTADLESLARVFHHEVGAMNEALAPLDACLMPGAMHPWMDPRGETRLWPQDEQGIYRTYDRIFGCRAHGWANLQSMHINLPFGSDEEFARLHGAVRLALPILPAIAASSPFRDGFAPGALDCRLEAYRDNASAVPAMNGELVPEPVATPAQYEERILAPLYRALAPLDPDGVLRHEWANARGAIPRFDRRAIEIRIVDVQECPAADVALAAAVVDLVWLLYRDAPADDIPTGELAAILSACVADGDGARIDSPRYLCALAGGGPCTALELWRRLARRMHDAPHRRLWEPMLDFILARGPLARRLLAAAGAAPTQEDLRRIYRRLCECLATNQRFDPSTSS
ncbi:MAG TPA: glutamate-cysteine ligase family protein [Burkholderiales bacterium]|nr:glutamate-cysteine ligase family protein [Burkholderiales bacterium]